MKTTQTAWRGRFAFTLIEMLVVIAIMVVLAGLILPAVQNSRAKAREITCMNNMRNLALACVMYRDTYKDSHIPDPPWLSTLYGAGTTGAVNKAVYLCPLDDKKGLDIPRWKYALLNPSATTKFYPETADNKNNATADAQFLAMRNTEIEACSYFFEFTCARATWGWSGTLSCSGGTCTTADLDKNEDGIVSWAETKEFQMAHGDLSQLNPPLSYTAPVPYPHGQFAMIRCFMHLKSPDGGRKEVLNVGYDARTFKSGVAWQQTYQAD